VLINITESVERTNYRLPSTIDRHMAMQQC
jgi:hypothetical protein